MTRKLRLVALRNERGMTQRELARRVNVSPSAVAHWESGLNEPTLENLFSLASAFDCSLDDLFERKASTPA